jgi:hypothetical protein
MVARPERALNYNDILNQAGIGETVVTDTKLQQIGLIGWCGACSRRVQDGENVFVIMRLQKRE